MRTCRRSRVQKFIARNRAPRVQIEYDVEIYGAEKKIQLPFVMGVMADLSGKPARAAGAGRRPQVPRDRRRQFRRPHEGDEAAGGVPGAEHADRRGQPGVDITFESMDDFSPDAVARKVEPLRKLLEARTQLANLLTYMDGKTGAEELIGRLLQRPGAAAGAGRRAQARRRPRPKPRCRAERPAMAETRHRRGAQRRGAEPIEPSEFADAPEEASSSRKTERREEAGRARRAHPGRAGAASTPTWSRPTSSARSRRSSPSIDQKLTEQVNQILHHPDFQQLEGAWRGLHHLVNNTETDEMLKIRVLEHLEEGAGQDAREVRGHRLGPEPDLQEDLHRGILDARRRAVSAAWSATTTSTTIPRTSSCCGNMAKICRRGAHAVHRRRRARRCSAWTAGRS